MCLSDAYLREGDEETLICEKVARLSQEADRISLVDLMGRVRTVQGSLASLDLLSNRIVIAAPAADRA